MSLVAHFAVQPEALRRFEDFRYVFEKLGFPQGRLCVRVPHSWEKAVLGLYSDEIDRRRIEAALSRYARQRIVDAPPIGSVRVSGWRSEVDAVHQRRPLSGVIVADGHADRAATPPSVRVTECDEEFFPDTKECRIPRRATAIAEIARELVRLSARIVLVDPHFDPVKRACLATLRELARVAREERCEYIDIVTKYDSCPIEPDALLSTKIGQEALKGREVPRVTVRFVEPPLSGDSFHHRFVLSDFGAIRFDAGLAAESDKQGNDVVLVEARRHQELVKQYFDGLPDFNVSEEWSWPSASPGLRLGISR